MDKSIDMNTVLFLPCARFKRSKNTPIFTTMFDPKNKELCFITS